MSKLPFLWFFFGLFAFIAGSALVVYVTGPVEWFIKRRGSDTMRERWDAGRGFAIIGFGIG